MSFVRVLKIAGAAAAAALLAGLAVWFTRTPVDPILLAWENLVPPSETGAASPPPVWGMVFDWTVPADLPVPIGREWAAPQTRVVDALEGKLVSIAGYVVPLDLDGTKVKEFLLVPYYGACIHVPPPPPNQIILVKLAHAVEVDTNFEPMVVTGKMHVARVSTNLADAGYQIAGDELTPYYQ